MKTITIVLLSILSSGAITCFDCPVSDGLFADPTDPHYYYNCGGGKAYRVTCNMNLVFNANINECDYPPAVNSDETADLKLNEEKKEEAINMLTMMLNQTTSTFIKRFGGRLLEGAKDLANTTDVELMNTTDPAKRHELIVYATLAYERLIKFITELAETVP